jgi:hypothetical protein
MSKYWKRTVWLTTLALPLSLLWLLPLGAQQKAEKTESAPATAPAPEPEAAADAPPADERVSADNNLTFPVDI